MKNELVVKSNQVIEASYRLSVIEQRVVLSAIAKIPKMFEVSDDEVYEVSVQDLQKLGVHEKTSYRDLKEAISRLYDRSISINIDNRLTKMRWVQRIDIIDNQSKIALRFSKDILPFISNVKTNFTQYMLSDVSKMQGAYSIRVYELLMQYKAVGERFLSIESLRFMLDLGDRYKQFNDLLKRVIDPAIDEINKLTNFKVTAEPLKTGRKFTDIKFTIKEKKKTTKSLNSKRDENTPDLFHKMTESQLDTFSSKLSELPEVQKMAHAGEDMKPFIARIRSMLKDPEKQKPLAKYLKQIGFKD